MLAPTGRIELLSAGRQPARLTRCVREQIFVSPKRVERLQPPSEGSDRSLGGDVVRSDGVEPSRTRLGTPSPNPSATALRVREESNPCRLA